MSDLSIEKHRVSQNRSSGTGSQEAVSHFQATRPLRCISISVFAGTTSYSPNQLTIMSRRVRRNQLLTAYTNLTFNLRSDDQQDLDRAAKFQTLMQVHVDGYDDFGKHEWDDWAFDNCIDDFMQVYGRRL